MTTRLEAIRDRCEKATEGPWYLGADFEARMLVRSSVNHSVVANTSAHMVDDSRFVEHSRADIPALLAVVDAVKKIQVETDFLNVDDELVHDLDRAIDALDQPEEP